VHVVVVVVVVIVVVVARLVKDVEHALCSPSPSPTVPLAASTSSS